jgi:hypothetical protein
MKPEQLIAAIRSELDAGRHVNPYLIRQLINEYGWLLKQIDDFIDQGLKTLEEQARRANA